jgi:hypothetical protein
MSFDEYDDSFVWKCDFCGRSAEFPPGDFWSALAELKSRGWLISREEDGWTHRCSRCRGRSTKITPTAARRSRGKAFDSGKALSNQNREARTNPRMEQGKREPSPCKRGNLTFGWAS